MRDALLINLGELRFICKTLATSFAATPLIHDALVARCFSLNRVLGKLLQTFLQSLRVQLFDLLRLCPYLR